MTKYKDREFPFEQVSFEETQLTGKEPAIERVRKNMAELMFQDLFAVAENGKYYKVYIPRTSWVRLEMYLKYANEMYGKNAEFVTNHNDRKIRVGGWVFIGF